MKDTLGANLICANSMRKNEGKCERFFKSFTHKVCACVILGANLICANSMRRNEGKYEWNLDLYDL